MRSFFGDRWFDLPGNNNELERGEAAYERMVSKAFAAYTERKNSQKKPKLKDKTSKPGKTRTPQEREKRRRKAEARRAEEAKKGNNEDGPKYPPVTSSEIHLIVFEGEAFQRIQTAIVDAIVDIANKQPCSDAFKKWGLTIPYDVVKSGNLKVAGVMALNQSNASQLLGWNKDQVGIAKESFRPKWYDFIYKKNIGEGVFVGVPTVVFNANADMKQSGGLREVVIHAFIHLGGREGNDDDSPHDLAHSPGYQEIIDACK